MGHGGRGRRLQRKKRPPPKKNVARMRQRKKQRKGFLDLLGVVNCWKVTIREGTDGRKGLSSRVCRFSLVLSASLMIKVFSPLSDVGRQGTFAGEFMHC